MAEGTTYKVTGENSTHYFCEYGEETLSFLKADGILLEDNVDEQRKISSVSNKNLRG